MTGSLTSCNQQVDKSIPKQLTYILFKSVKEVVGKNGETPVAYEVQDYPLDDKKLEILVAILKKYNWEFLLTNKNEVLISSTSIQNLDDLYGLNAELDKQIKAFLVMK